MSNLSQTQYHLKALDELSQRRIGINRIHPLIQLLLTFVFLVITVSYEAHEIAGLMPLLLYPIMIAVLSDIPVKPILLRFLITLPFILGIGILNPIFDQSPYSFGGFVLARGWLTFFSLFLKGFLTVMAALLLLSTCGLPRLAKSLRLLKVPKVIVMQLLLTYRYLTVLMEEVARTLTAYSLRAPGHKGVHYKAWGSLIGQLLLRTIERAERIYQAMRLRGFQGDFPDAPLGEIALSDILYGLCWVLYFILVRKVNIPVFLGGLL